MTSRRQPVVLLLLLAVVPLAVVSGCEGDSAFSMGPGAGVVTPVVDSVILQSDGGGNYRVIPPAGVACDPLVWTYTFSVRDAHTLTWSRCAVSSDGTKVSDYTPSTGSRVLSDSEFELLRTTAGAVRVSSRTACGADRARLFIEVRSGSSSQQYGDDFYACDRHYQYYVESASLDGLAQRLATLAHD